MDKVNSEAAAGLQPVLLRDVIDWAAFSEDVLRFESRPEEPRRPIPMNLMIVLLSVIVDVSEALDVIKKGVFYGKAIDDDYLYFTVWRAYSALKKITDPALRNAVAYRPGAVNMREFHALLGMVTESGEIANALVTSLRGETPLDTANVLEELGDHAWYQAVFLDEKHFAMGAVLRLTQAKLARRYGAKYNDASAVQRDLTAERTVIEQHASPASDR